MPRDQQFWVRAGVLTIGAFVVASYALFPAIVAPLVRRDREEAAPRAGVGVVAILVPAEPGMFGEKQAASVSVRFHGGIEAAAHITDFQALRLGQPAKVIYRIGKSGRIYVDSVGPIVH
ncbi:MAG: hypothetical protein KGJ62_02260 [Armatimonadetes bacterium]|nr:hypothetical protein [Armatimonadota bacterium]MDE2205356.1 hypothetical protein [Armatimonadota bacterium]